MTILVTGANGQLGNEMRIVAKDSRDRFIFTDICDESQDSLEMIHKLAGEVDTRTVKLDITDLDAVREMVTEEDVKVIVNCAAYTNVDAAESNINLAKKLNTDAPKNLAIVMKEVNGLIIHVSTDYVFGGDLFNTPCRETQDGTPTGVYGSTKLHGELGVLAIGCNYVILRTAWLYSEFGRNFVRTMLNLTASKSHLNVVFDQVGTPTYALDLARVISAIINDFCLDSCKDKMHEDYSKNGIYHYSNEGVCSWYDFAKLIADSAGHLNCNILPCRSDEFPSPVKRPSYSVLDKTKIKRTFGLLIPYWMDSLKHCLQNVS